MTSEIRCIDPVKGKAAELIPWYVNGTLPEHEKADLERHLGECLVCRAALKEEQRMQAATRMQADVPVSPQHGVLDLLRRIEREAPASRTSRRGLRLGYAAAFVVFVASGWLVLSRPDSQQVPFSTLTSAESSAATLIDIVFADSVTEEEMVEIVRSIDGELVAGPSDIGRYTVSVNADSDRAATAVIESLSDDPRVRFVSQNYIPVPSAEAEESQ